MPITVKRLSEMSDEEWALYESGEWDGSVEVVMDDEEYDYDQEGNMNFGHIAGFLGYPPTSGKPTTPTPRGTTYTSYQKCSHNGLDVAFKLNVSNRTYDIAGGSGFSTKGDEKTRLILDLAGALNDKPWVESGPQALVSALQWTFIPRDIPVLRVAWSDRAAPMAPGTWWKQLLDLIVATYDDGRITIACVGGHGRTGTAMAALLLAAIPDMTAAEAIDKVREWHCEKAIESASQFWYLYDMRPGETMTEEHAEEIAPPKQTVYTPPTSTTPTTTAATTHPEWCTWNNWCQKKRNHSGRCKGYGSTKA